MNNKKILIFGDSFIGPFTLIKDKRYIITKFKGGTLKGIIKPTNQNHIKMRKIINKYKDNIEGIIFFFGSVDVHFSYYYNNINNKSENNTITNIKKTLNLYKDMILNILKTININKVVVINPFINPVEKEFKIAILQLLNYHIITHKDLSINNMKIINNSIKNANSFFFKYSELMAKTFNNKLESSLDANNKNSNIVYINFNNQTINNINNPKNAVINPKYKDFGLTNIHLLYKPVLFLFLNKILKPVYNISYSQKQINYFLKDENAYIKQKKESINELLKRTDKEKREMFTNEAGQIDYYNAEKAINKFYNIYLKDNKKSKTLKKSYKNITNKKTRK
jgi:hypothetical protein